MATTTQTVTGTSTGAAALTLAGQSAPASAPLLKSFKIKPEWRGSTGAGHKASLGRPGGPGGGGFSGFPGPGFPGVASLGAVLLEAEEAHLEEAHCKDESHAGLAIHIFSYF